MASRDTKRKTDVSSGGRRDEIEREGYDPVHDAPRKEDVKDNTFIGWPLKKEDCLTGPGRFMALWNARTNKQLSISYNSDSGGIIAVRDARKGKNSEVVYKINLKDHGNDWKRTLTKADRDLQAKCAELRIKLQREDRTISEISEQETKYQMTYGSIGRS